MNKPASPLQTLALQWRVVFEIFMLAARRFARLEQAGARGAEARAEALEIQIHCALVILTRQISEHRANNLNSEDQCILEYLAVLTSALLMLAMVAAKMRAELAEHSANGTAGNRCETLLANKGGPIFAYSIPQSAIQIGAQGYFDSS